LRFFFFYNLMVIDAGEVMVFALSHVEKKERSRAVAAREFVFVFLMQGKQSCCCCDVLRVRVMGNEIA
jgi:uncharacterized UBP type Zn finger protein